MYSIEITYSIFYKHISTKTVCLVCVYICMIKNKKKIWEDSGQYWLPIKNGIGEKEKGSFWFFDVSIWHK